MLLVTEHHLELVISNLIRVMLSHSLYHSHACLCLQMVNSSLAYWIAISGESSFAISETNVHML
jgi:hypothetical protein